MNEAQQLGQISNTARLFRAFTQIYKLLTLPSLLKT